MPTFNEEIRMRTRPELLRLLHDVTSFLRHLNYEDIKNEKLQLEYRFLRRLARKLKYRLSTFNSVYSPICSCSNISESCAGVVSEGITKLDRIYCKFTGRRIPVVIFKTYDVPAPWVRMKSELLEKARSRHLCEQNLSLKEKSLTYAHITAESLPAVKCLLENYFWSNIDVSTIMQYPEFSCVVFYGKLVVGFGYLTPGGHRNEGYINFLFVRPHWRRCGIGGFILYLLRQQCLYWTLTLHVSPKSEALNLYHKFGFKICSRITNFYADYVISNSQDDKDALFMKLESKLPQVY